MTTSFAPKDPGFGYGLSFSTALHLSLLALLTFSHIGIRTVPPEKVYYVDVVNLPVLHPQAGATIAPAQAPPAPLAPAAAPPTPTRDMKLKTTAAKNAAAKPAAQAPAAPTAGDTSREFEDRIARMERDADERRQAAALAALQKRVAAGTAAQAGIPKGTGEQAGSDYASYIQSRLYDAFKLPKTLPAKNQEVQILLSINRSGRVAEYRIERSTGDKVFEDAVARAVALAERTFRPPPNNSTFEQKFVFRPDSVGKK